MEKETIASESSTATETTTAETTAEATLPPGLPNDVDEETVYDFYTKELFPAIWDPPCSSTA